MIVFNINKIVFVTSLFIINHLSYSQSYYKTKFSSYNISYNGKTYDLEIRGNNENYVITIALMSYDIFNNQGYIQLGNNQHHEFVKALIEAKQKYEEWMERIKQSTQTERLEPLEIAFETEIRFRYGGRWLISDKIKLTWILQKNNEENLEYLLRISTGKIHNEYNKSETHTGFGIVFNSASEIQALLDELTDEKIKAALNTRKLLHDN
ncbi:MAG: hypothetical protein H6586_01560 [Flavobacteriales bacterium]|nr:hypothetical protein [Flavobacteriales bacterium]